MNLMLFHGKNMKKTRNATERLIDSLSLQVVDSDDLHGMPHNSGRSKQAVQPPSPVPSFHHRMVGEWLVTTDCIKSCVICTLKDLKVHSAHSAHSAQQYVDSTCQVSIPPLSGMGHCMPWQRREKHSEAFFTIVFWLYICDVS